jgi:hypothetical protein
MLSLSCDLSCKKMVINYVDKRTGIQPVCGLENLRYLFVYRMFVGKSVNVAVQLYASLYTRRKVKLLLPFYKVADHVSGGDIGVAKGQVCMREIVHNDQFTKKTCLSCNLYSAVASDLI